MKIFGFEISFPFSLFPKEKRRAERLGIFEALYVRYRCLDSEGRGSGAALDLSQVGILFLSEHPIPSGARLELMLRFTPGSVSSEVYELPVEARVVRCRKRFNQKYQRVACEFEGLSPEVQQIIAHFIGWLKERQEKYLFFRYQPPA